MFSIQDIRMTSALPFFLVEHDMNLIMDISDRILALNYGEKIADGLPEEIQRHPESSRLIWARGNCLEVRNPKQKC